MFMIAAGSLLLTSLAASAVASQAGLNPLVGDWRSFTRSPAGVITPQRLTITPDLLSFDGAVVGIRHVTRRGDLVRFRTAFGIVYNFQLLGDGHICQVTVKYVGPVPPARGDVVEKRDPVNCFERTTS